MSLSSLHEILVALFRERPSLARDLLGSLLDEDLPSDPSRIAEASFTQIAPTEYIADLVVLIGEPPRLGIIVEVQLQRDDRKRFTWPLYACALRARLECPVVVLVFATEAQVAAWAGERIPLGPGEAVFRPIAIGPQAVPRITSTEAARASPQLTVLSAWAHGNEPDHQEVLQALAEALLGLPRRDATVYYDLIGSRLDDAARRILEEAMELSPGYEYMSDWARDLIAKGRAEGQAEARANEASRIVLRLLVRRFGLLGQPLQARVESLDVDKLEALAEDSVDFRSIADLEAWLSSSN